MAENIVELTHKYIRQLNYIGQTETNTQIAGETYDRHVQAEKALGYFTRPMVGLIMEA